METNEFVRKIVEILEDNKAEDIVVMDVSAQTDIADRFILANGTSDRMIQALTDYVIDGVREACHVHAVPQGVANGGWMLIDFGDVIVHIFSPDRRSYYSLEDLYKESKVLLKAA